MNYKILEATPSLTSVSRGDLVQVRLLPISYISDEIFVDLDGPKKPPLTRIKNPCLKLGDLTVNSVSSDKARYEHLGHSRNYMGLIIVGSVNIEDLPENLEALITHGLDAPSQSLLEVSFIQE